MAALRCAWWKQQRSRCCTRPAELPDVTPGTTEAALLKFIQKGPHTSGELITLSKLSSGSVYTTLSKMKGEGKIETREDEADGQRKWFIRGAQ